jgi:hypothetical protein
MTSKARSRRAESRYCSTTAYTLNLLRSGLFLLIVLSMAAAAALPGPGGSSLDARLFVRREIIIPHAPGPHKP